MRKILVAKDLAYAASKTSATEHTAKLSYTLKEGAIGIYGIPNTSTNNKEKMALIIEGGADAAGLVPDASFDGLGVHIAVGTANGVYTSGEIDIAGVVKYKAQAYTAPVAQVIDVSLDPWAVIAKRDSAIIRVVDQENMDQGGAIKSDIINFSYSTNASDSDYVIATGLVNANIAHPKQWVSSIVTSTTTGAVFTTSATVTAVKGETSLTTSANHGVGVGDYVRLGSDTYQAVTGTATTTLVLDEPYRGASATIANADTKDLGTDPGTIGIKFTSLIMGRNFEISCQEVIEDSTIVYTTAGIVGHGHQTLVQKTEERFRGYLGSTAGATDATMPYPAIKSVVGISYDTYVFTIKNPGQDGTGATAKTAHNLYTELVVVFPDSAVGNGQADFEKILGEVLYGATDLGDLYS